MHGRFGTAIGLLLLFSVGLAEQGARYLIVAPDQYVQAVQPLAAWKTRKGMLAKVVPTSVTGTDTAQIHRYVVDAYNTWDVRPEYLLLLGDPAAIRSLTYDNDCYYGDMSGDYRMEIPVGRFPARGVHDCSTFVAKVLAYEKPPEAGDTSWRLRGTTVLREDFPPDAYYQMDARTVRGWWVADGFVQAESLSDFQGNSSADVTAAANAGRAFITYRGQGLGTWYTPFNVVDPFSWRNGARMPVVVAGTCATVTLAPYETMYGDKFMCAGSPDSLGGAVAYFGTARAGSGISLYRGTCYRGFFHALFQEGAYRLGAATMRGRRWIDSLCPDQSRYVEWTLLGDPEMNVWTAVPLRPSVEHDSVIRIGPCTYAVRVSVGGIRRAGAQVCVSMDSTVYAWATTDSAGEANLAIAPVHQGAMSIVVTGRNLRPYIGTCRVAVSDVGCTRVTVPLGTLDSGTTVTPACSVSNYGSQSETYRVRLRIGGDYEDSVLVTNHAPGTAGLVSFSQWTGSSRGSFSVTCSTMLAGDERPLNDQVFDSVTVLVHDVAVSSIQAPAGTYTQGTAVVPSATWRNRGNAAATFRAWMLLDDPSGTRVYSESADIVGLEAGADTSPDGFAACTLSTSGHWAVRCSSFFPADMHPANNLADGQFGVRPSGAPGWQPATGLPVSPSGKYVKDGGWLAYNAGDNSIYAAKGNKVGDFYFYDPVADVWAPMPLIPNGTEGKTPYKGAAGCASGDGIIYCTKGNNTAGFHRFDAGTGTWTQLKDVPLGLSNKKVKGGTDMVYVTLNDTGYVYLMKGYKAEYYRYNTMKDTWQALPDVPGAPKCDKGSFLAYDEDHLLYAHKAKSHEMNAFNAAVGTWGPAMTGMPFLNRQGKSKKSKDGGCGVWADMRIWALKGGNTLEFWRYDVAANVWAEMETMPAMAPGSTKKKKVKAGADIVADAGGVIYATKGNKTNELWRYEPAAYGLQLAAPSRDGVLARDATSNQQSAFSIVPNPLRSGFAVLRFSSLATSNSPLAVTIFDASGRLVLNSSLVTRNSSLQLDLRGLRQGVYLVTFSVGDLAATQKLVVQR